MNEKTVQDHDFEAKLAKSTYKTTSSAIGTLPNKCNPLFYTVPMDKGYGINGKFTDVTIFFS